MLKRRFILGLLALAALAMTAADASRAQTRPEVTEEFHQTYPLASGGRVSLSNINGAVRVVAWDRDELKVDAVKKAYTQERLREAQIKVDAGPGRVRIETEYPESSYRWSNRDSERHENPATVEYTLTVPRGAALDEVKLINGGLNLEGLSGPVHASSINGRVVASNLSGPVNLSVINGALEVRLDRLGDAGAVTLSSVNGPLTVTLPSDANAHVRASSVHGRISNDFNLPVRVGEYVGRDLEGRLGRGGASVRLSNVNGAIAIRRAADGRTPSAATNLLSEARTREDFDDDDAADASREAGRELGDEERERRREAKRAERETERETARAAREAARAARDATRTAERAAEQAAKAIDKEALKERIEEGLKGVEGLRGGALDSSAREIQRESNTFAVSGAPRVRVETFDGPVSVHAWDKPEVMYTVTKRATDAREMKGVSVRAQAAGGEVTLRAEFDKTFARVVQEREGRVTSYVSNASAEFDIYVPRNSTLFVSSGDGRLRVDGVSGEVDLRTGDGPIDVTGARGRLRAETGDGRIRVENFDGDAEARTGDGRITLDGNFRSLAARTGDGTIALTLPEGVNATIETNAGSVFNDGVAVAETETESRVRRWRIGSGGQLISLRTGDGQIILRRR